MTAAMALACSALVLLPAAPAAADEAVCETTTTDDPQTDPVKRDSVPALSMQIPQAREAMLTAEQPVEPGAGIGVAVVDSGILGNLGKELSVRGGLDAGQPTVSYVAYPQGTVVAGLIAGATRNTDTDDLDDDQPVGIAPGADLYDVRVYDSTAEESTSTEDIVTPGPDQVAAGLQTVLDNLGGVGGGAPIKIVNVSMQVQPTEAVTDAVKELADRGVVVVASSGDRPDDAETAGFLSDYAHEGAPPPGEDAADDVAPANAGAALAVTASGPLGSDLSQDLLRNSQTDLAAPTAGAVSYALNESTCVLGESGARWATAQVSGVLALLWSHLGADTPAQRVVDVLMRTASGNGEQNPTTGYGVVQPLEAITRPLGGGADGDLPELQTDVAGEQPATAPEPEEDPLASTRRNAIWWGLVGGAALVVALILRPLLARRRD